MKIEDKIKDILFKLSGERIKNNSVLLKEDLALDSLLMVVLLIEIEEYFSIRLKESDMNPFELNTVQSVIDMVSRYCKDENE